MTTLLMNTEAVTQLSVRLRQTARMMIDGSASLQHNVTYMPWESNTRDQYVSEVHQAMQRLRADAEKLNALADVTQKEVSQWIETDAHLSGAVAAYRNQTVPSQVSIAGVVDKRTPAMEWLGDNTPLAFIPGFTPPAGGDIETIDSRLEDKFGRDVNLVDGNQQWTDYEAAAVDRAVSNLPDVLAKQSLIRNIYRDKSEGGDMLAFWVPPNNNQDIYGKHENQEITFLSPMPLLGTRQGSAEAGERVETVIFHELVHSAQFKSDGNPTDLTQSYMEEFGWSVNDNMWKYTGNENSFPGVSDKSFLGESVAYPVSNRTGLEDMAEAVTYFQYEPETLLRDSPERYQWVKNNIFNGQEFL